MTKQPETPKITIEPDAPDHGSIGHAGAKIARDSDPALKMASGFGQSADKLFMSVDHCVLYLSRRIGEVRQSQERSKSLFGRLKNKMLSEETDKVALSGAVLANVMEYVGDPVPDEFDRGKDYSIRFEIAENLHERLLQKARSEGIIE